MKQIIFIIAFLIPVSLLAQGEFVPNTRTEADSASLGAMFVTGTGIDTSDKFIAWGWEAFNFFVGDTSSGGDSSSIRFYVDICTDPITLQDWVVEDSLTVSTDSTWTKWLYQDEARLPFPWKRIRAAGQDGNKKLSATKSIVRHSGWNSTRR